MVVQLFGYEVYEFPWGKAIMEQRQQKWIAALLNNGTEISFMGMDVELYTDGIEFCDYGE